MLKNLTNESFRLGVITFHPQSDYLIESIDQMYSIKVPKGFLFQLKANKRFMRHFQDMFRTHLLVAGDPWESFFASVLFSKLTRIRLRIQVQVHGDIGNQLWISHNWRNRIRSVVSFLTFKLATEVRATSKTQAAHLVTKYGVDSKKIHVIPVPSFYESNGNFPESKSLRPKSLGLVGRLEHDRGLDSFVELVAKLGKVNHDFFVVVAGSGKLRSKLQKSLELHLPTSRIKFLGEVEPSDMEITWNMLGILVSCAPTESYGRAMRESLVNGIPVWATPSTGSAELSKLARQGMRILNLADTPEALNKKFEELLVYDVDESLRKALIDSDRKLISELVSSWVPSSNNGLTTK